MVLMFKPEGYEPELEIGLQILDILQAYMQAQGRSGSALHGLDSSCPEELICLPPPKTFCRSR
jgi:hypothetical protein